MRYNKKKKRLPASREAVPLLESKLATRSYDHVVEPETQVPDDEPEMFVPKDKPFKIVSQANSQSAKFQAEMKKGKGME